MYERWGVEIAYAFLSDIIWIMLPMMPYRYHAFVSSQNPADALPRRVAQRLFLSDLWWHFSSKSLCISVQFTAKVMNGCGFWWMSRHNAAQKMGDCELHLRVKPASGQRQDFIIFSIQVSFIMFICQKNSSVLILRSLMLLPYSVLKCIVLLKLNWKIICE